MSLSLPQWILSESAGKSWIPTEEILSNAFDDEETIYLLPSAGAKLGLNKACDFTFWTAQKNLTAQREGRVNGFGSNLPAVAPETTKEDDFTLVDSTKLIRAKGKYNKRTRTTAQIAQQQQQRAQQQQQRQMQQRYQQRQTYQRGGKKDKLGAAYQQQRMQTQNLRWNSVRNRAVMAEYVADISPDWIQKSDTSIQSLANRQLVLKDIQISDVEWRGQCRSYVKELDRVLPKSIKELPDKYSKEYTHVVPGCRVDEVLVTMIEEDKTIDVVITDQMLTTLMTAPLSRYAWQIYLYKLDNKIIFEKPENAALDLLPVNETAPEIAADGRTRMQESGLEAAKSEVDFFFTSTEQQPIVVQHGSAGFDENVPATKLYRYRKVKLPPGRLPPNAKPTSRRTEPITLAIRTEIHAATLDAENNVEELMVVHALNEGVTRPGALRWAEALERHKGALLVTELKNNSCKIAKWVYSASLAGADTMKTGFLTRRNEKQHLLAVQTSRVTDLTSQMGLKVANAWGFVREILDIVYSDLEEEGLYIITRDALTSQIKIHFNPEGMADNDDKDSAEEQA